MRGIARMLYYLHQAEYSEQFPTKGVCLVFPPSK